MLETQPGESFEITIESAQYRAMFDRNGGEVRITCQVAAATRPHQQSPQHRSVTIGGADDARTRMRKPFIHHAQCDFNWQGFRHDARLRAQT